MTSRCCIVLQLIVTLTDVMCASNNGLVHEYNAVMMTSFNISKYFETLEIGSRW